MFFPASHSEFHITFGHISIWCLFQYLVSLFCAFFGVCLVHEVWWYGLEFSSPAYRGLAAVSSMRAVSSRSALIQFKAHLNSMSHPR